MRLRAFHFVLACTCAFAVVSAGCAWKRTGATRTFDPQPCSASKTENVSFSEALRTASPWVVSVSSMGSGAEVEEGAADRGPPDATSQASATQASEGDLGASSSQGAGFFVDGSGTVVTAAHVVSGATQVLVKVADLSVFEAELVGIDEDVDLAVLKIAYASVTPPVFGRPDASRTGDWVLAVGDPFGLQRSVVAGIVAGQQRHLAADGDGYYIQIDMALNPGNSGGPLLNACGAIIGMNLRTAVGPQGTDGVSFSIPIEAVLQIADELERGTWASRPRLGATFEDVSAEIAIAARRSRASGAVITGIAPDGTARSLQLSVGDIVVAMNDQAVEDGADLARLLLAWRTLPGTRMVVWRAGRYQLLLAP